MTRKLLLIGNWKMNKTAKEAAAYAKDFLPRVQKCAGIDIAVCPPFTALPALAAACVGSNVQLGAQDLCWKIEGAFTGEISAAMLKEFSVQCVLIGHSERRQYLDEGNEVIAKKVQTALATAITPVLCVGENAMQRKTGHHKTFVQSQLSAALKTLKASEVAKLIIAYEPIWAIGTGTPATPKQAQEMHAMIRVWVEKQYDAKTAAAIRIIYGASANADNCRTLFEQLDIDGLLPGGASLDPAVFATMAGIAAEVGRKKGG